MGYWGKGMFEGDTQWDIVGAAAADVMNRRARMAHSTEAGVWESIYNAMAATLPVVEPLEGQAAPPLDSELPLMTRICLMGILGEWVVRAQMGIVEKDIADAMTYLGMVGLVGTRFPDWTDWTVIRAALAPFEERYMELGRQRQNEYFEDAVREAWFLIHPE